MISTTDLQLENEILGDSVEGLVGREQTSTDTYAPHTIHTHNAQSMPGMLAVLRVNTSMVRSVWCDQQYR